MFEFHRGIRISGTGLWLDAERAVDLSCVSHAHMDHVRNHKHIIATEATIRFAAQRVGKSNTTALAFGVPHELTPDCRVTLIPAGHILGSAQVLVEKDGHRLLYTGDFKVQPNLTAESIQVVEADVLIMESTFGDPRYRFPKREVIVQRLVNFVEKAFQDGCVPVVAGYALGKAQEAMKILADAGFPLSVHGSVFALAQTYMDHGIDFGDVVKYHRDHLDGRVLICPPSALRNRVIQRIPNRRTVFLTGWAVHRGTKYRYQVDEALPLSDHADFNELIEFVHQVRPKKIYTTHGPKDFHLHLQRLGFAAEPLAPQPQLTLL
jgi:Cft2 family RNA processing exonuclease